MGFEEFRKKYELELAVDYAGRVFPDIFEEFWLEFVPLSHDLRAQSLEDLDWERLQVFMRWFEGSRYYPTFVGHLEKQFIETLTGRFALVYDAVQTE